MTNTMRCTYCGTVGLQPGFIEDNAPHGRGAAQWVAGAIQRNLLGYARTARRPHLQIEAFHCAQCGHLEMFASRAD
jgi:hypothetical protein